MSEAVTVALAIRDATAHLESQPHRPLLEAIPDGRQTDASKLELDESGVPGKPDSAGFLGDGIPL